MSFHLIIIEDDRGDEHPIAVAGAKDFEEAGPKAHRHAYDVLQLNVEGYADGGQIDRITTGMTAIR
jgi:hypothetical protein